MSAITADGSQFRIFCSTDFGGTDIVGINPIKNVQSFTDSIELCVAQGTACSGVTYGIFPGQTGNLAYLKKSVTLQGFTNSATYKVDGAMRLTGPAEASIPLLNNGDFATGALDPWTSTTSIRGTSWEVIDGVA